MKHESVTQGEVQRGSKSGRAGGNTSAGGMGWVPGGWVGGRWVLIKLIVVLGVGGLIAPPCDLMSAEYRNKVKRNKGLRTRHPSIIWK